MFLNSQQKYEVIVNMPVISCCLHEFLSAVKTYLYDRYFVISFK